MRIYCECGHSQTSHDGWLRGCVDCECMAFEKAKDQTPPRVVLDVDPQEARMERAVVALESIAKSLDAIAWEKR